MVVFLVLSTFIVFLAIDALLPLTKNVRVPKGTHYTTPVLKCWVLSLKTVVRRSKRNNPATPCRLPKGAGIIAPTLLRDRIAAIRLTVNQYIAGSNPAPSAIERYHAVYVQPVGHPSDRTIRIVPPLCVS